jgi:single stranded DNA-binding protein
VANLRVPSPKGSSRTVSEWRDGDTSSLRVNVWRGQAEHAAESLSRGSRVVVTGRLRQRSWETPEGDQRSVTEIEADEVGASLKWATVERTSQRGNGDCSSGWERPAERGGEFNDTPPYCERASPMTGRDDLPATQRCRRAWLRPPGRLTGCPNRPTTFRSSVGLETYSGPVLLGEHAAERQGEHARGRSPAGGVAIASRLRV